MNVEQLVARIYEGITLSELEALVSDIAAERISESDGPNCFEYDRLCERQEELMFEELAAHWQINPIADFSSCFVDVWLDKLQESH